MAKKGTQSHRGLVLRNVTVKRGSKTFTQKRWVKSSDDESESKKDKIIDDDSKKVGLFSVGDEINILDKKSTIVKVSESEKTLKMDDGKVYTQKAIEKYAIKIKKEDSKDIKEDDNKKDIKSKKLKPKSKVKIIKEKVKELPKNGSVLLKDLVKTEKEGKKFVEDHGWVWDEKSDIFTDVDGIYNLYMPIMLHSNKDCELYGMSQCSIEEEYDKKIGHIFFIEINTPMRGKGYGRQMMENIIGQLSECDRVTLSSLDENSNKFYDAIGMEEDGRKHYEGSYNGNKKWMNKILGNKKDYKS